MSPLGVAVAVWTLVGVGLAGAIRLGWVYWPDGVFSDMTSGVWAALARNFRPWRILSAGVGVFRIRRDALHAAIFQRLRRAHPVRMSILFSPALF